MVLDALRPDRAIEWVGGFVHGLAISGCSLPAGGALGGGWPDVFANPNAPGAVLTIGDAMGYGEPAASLRHELHLIGRDFSHTLAMQRRP
jgi:hypothetical protein